LGVGSGWTAAGIDNKYNEIAQQVKIDRRQKGYMFNQEQYKYCIAKTQTKVREKHTTTRRKKPVPYDDLDDDCDWEEEYNNMSVSSTDNMVSRTGAAAGFLHQQDSDATRKCVRKCVK
jgi:hypothetical protein